MFSITIIITLIELLSSGVNRGLYSFTTLQEFDSSLVRILPVCIVKKYYFQLGSDILSVTPLSFLEQFAMKKFLTKEFYEKKTLVT